MSAAVKERPVPTYDHLTKKKPVEIRDWVPLDDTSVDEFNEAKNELEAARLIGDEARILKAERLYAKAEAALKANSIEMVFRSIGRPAFEALKHEHPPTEEQVEEHKKAFGVPPDYDAESFAAPLIAETCVQPKMTVKQVEDLTAVHGWNAGEFAHIFQLALRVNQGRRTANLAF